MKTNFSNLKLARTAFLAAVTLAAPSAFAAGTQLTYAAGDVFIGFRQANVANTLAVDLGSASQFIPTSLGGSWNGAAFNVTFGIVPTGNPGAGNTVFNLNADLTSVFGATWFENFDPSNSDPDKTNPGNDLSWAVAGISNNTANNSPINGLNAGSAFTTIARGETTPNTKAGAPLNFDTAQFQDAFNNFAQGGGSGFKGRISTVNSNKALSASGSLSNNWGTRIGPVGSTFTSGVNGEQPLTGSGAGPTNSILDFYLLPSDGSTLNSGAPAYLGSFSLNNSGQLSYSSYSAVPEPDSYALFGLGIALFGMARRHRRTVKTPSLA